MKRILKEGNPSKHSYAWKEYTMKPPMIPCSALTKLKSQMLFLILGWISHHTYFP